MGSAILSNCGFIGGLDRGIKEDVTWTNPLMAAPWIWPQGIEGQVAQFDHPEAAIPSDRIQGKGADLFAFGRVMQQYVLNQMILQLGRIDNASVTPIVMQHLRPRMMQELAYTAGDLKEFEKMDPGLVFYAGRNNEGKVQLWIYPTPEAILGWTLKAIGKLEEIGSLFPYEFMRMRELANLAADLQTTTKEEFLRKFKCQDENYTDHLVANVIARLQDIQAIKSNSAFAPKTLGFEVGSQDEEDPIEFSQQEDRDGRVLNRVRRQEQLPENHQV